MRRYILLALCVLPSCAPFMEANRPDPVDMTRFVPGEKRIDVLAEVGTPVASTPEGDQSCDVYRLFTHGPGSVGKGAIAAGEVEGDILTLGLSEVLFTPAEAMTKNAKHTVTFCYGTDGKLVSAKESETLVDWTSQDQRVATANRRGNGNNTLPSAKAG